MHTGRSRNDQSATDVRRWMKRELMVVADRIVGLQGVLLQRAEAAGETYLPGYTHLQRAQPVLLAHHLLAHGWALGRDIDRLLDALERIDISPLGAGALAGSSLPLDPDFTAADLGFAARFENSLDAVGSRDHVAEALFALTMVGINLSRLGEEFVLWTTDEFGFAKLDDGYATGSSMLPQKKNPDIAELARGKAGRLIGDLTGFLATMKGLPLSYNRDYQEDKEPLFDAVDQISLALGAITGMVATATWVPERMQAAADSETGSATDLAEWLVQRRGCRSARHTPWSGRWCVGPSPPARGLAARSRRGRPSARLRRRHAGGAGRGGAAAHHAGRRRPGAGGGCSSSASASAWRCGVRRLPPTFAERDATLVAPELLNKLLRVHGIGSRASPRWRPTRPTTRRATRSGAVQPAMRRCSATPGTGTCT